MNDCSKILDESFMRAKRPERNPFIGDSLIQQRVEAVALCLKNRAGVRALLAGLLAKLHSPKVDIRKPYTDITGENGNDTYSGRLYDERYIQRLMDKPYNLPINSTTAFLTPGFRTKNIVLRTDTRLEGRPAERPGPREERPLHGIVQIGPQGGQIGQYGHGRLPVWPVERRGGHDTVHNPCLPVGGG